MIKEEFIVKEEHNAFNQPQIKIDNQIQREMQFEEIKQKPEQQNERKPQVQLPVINVIKIK